MRAAVRAAALIMLATCAYGCGAAGHRSAGAHLPPTLSPHAVPYLPSTVKPLTAAGIAREAGAPRLRRQLGSWGFLDGADRYFQGESHRLQVVDSRTLRFSSKAGAVRFVDFVRNHAAVYLGSLPGLHAFSSRGRTGIIATAQECQCHLANPAYLGVVVRGGAVTWLEINGPGASPDQLTQLIAAAP